MEQEIKRYWDRIDGYVSEHKIDARWILRSPDDDLAHGSLRIVNHPDLPAGHLRAMSSFVTSRRPKTQEEIEQSVEDYQMNPDELEIYSVNEHITTKDNIIEMRSFELEELFGVKIFKKDG
jgi:hypothetical protein